MHLQDRNSFANILFYIDLRLSSILYIMIVSDYIDKIKHKDLEDTNSIK